MTPIADDEITRLTDDELLALVHTRSRRFDRLVRFRDWRELIASAVVAIMIAPTVVRGSLLSRVGASIVLLGLALVAVRLWRARHVARLDANDLTVPVAVALRAERDRIDAQINLLSSVAWWYVTPLIGGSMLIVAGSQARAGWWFTAGYCTFAIALGWGIVVMNRHAVRRTLQPKRQEIVTMLAQIES